MKFFLSILLFIFFIATPSFSQKNEKKLTVQESDTLEGETTDTSIVYIIKKAPVTIREKIEIQREKQKQYFHLSWAFQGFIYSERRKAASGHEDYVKALNTKLTSLPSYSIGLRLWKAPKEYVYGISITSRRILQKFRVNDSVIVTNNYNYGSIGIHYGKYFKKGQKISYLIHGGILGDFFVSAKGYTIDKINTSLPARINRVIKYNTASASIIGSFTILIAVKNSFLEIEPYIIIAPFSATAKTEFHSTVRNFIGLRIAYTNKLF